MATLRPIYLNGLAYNPCYGDSDNNVVTGSEDRDFMESYSGDDDIYGYGGDDIAKGALGNDRLFGGAGNDRLFGGDGIDQLYGDSGDDYLCGDGGTSNVYVGGQGNDLIDTGLYWAATPDIVKYKFDVIGTNVNNEFADYIIKKGFSQYVTDGEVSDGMLENVFVRQYKGWLKEIVVNNDLGTDINQDGVIDVGFYQNSNIFMPKVEGVSSDVIVTWFNEPDDIMVKTGSTLQQRYYYDSFIESKATLQPLDGLDTVLYFDSNDSIELLGVTAAVFKTMGKIETGDFNADSIKDTFVGGVDHSWGITLLGYTGLADSALIFG